MSASFIDNDDLAFLDGFLLLFILLNDVRFRASVVFCLRISRFFLMLVPWFLLHLIGVVWFGYGWMVFSWY